MQNSVGSYVKTVMVVVVFFALFGGFNTIPAPECENNQEETDFSVEKRRNSLPQLFPCAGSDV